MRQVTLSRQDAEFGLLPPVCIVCGRSSAQTQSVRLFASTHPQRTPGLSLGIFRRLRRSLVMLVPVCSDHQNLRAFRAQSGVRMVALSTDTVTLANVAEPFAREWAAGSARRVAPVAPLPWAKATPPADVSQPIDLVTAVDVVEPDGDHDRSLAHQTPGHGSPAHAEGGARQRAGQGAQRLSLWTLFAMVAVVTPLVMISGILMLSVMKPQRRDRPRPPGPDAANPAPLDRAARKRELIRGDELFRRHRRLEMRQAEQNRIDQRGQSD